MTPPLTELLTRAEQPEPLFDAEDVGRWPGTAFDRLILLGLLVEADLTPAIACDACGHDHVEAVEWIRVPGREPRAFIPCPAEGRVQVDLTRLKRWSVRLSKLVEAVGRVLRSNTEPEQRVLGRVWRLGAVHVGGRALAGFLAVGLRRSDAASVVASVPELRAANAVVFVPSVIPTPTIWATGSQPTVISLADVLSVDANGLVVDHAFLEAALAPASRSQAKTATKVFPTPPGSRWEQVELVVEDHRVLVRVGDVSRVFGFAEAGFEDRRKKNFPDECWAFLKTLARFNGVLGTGDNLKTKSGDLKQKVSDLRGRLRALLGIEDDPFAMVRKGKPYRARFTIRAADGATFPTPTNATWEDITITESKPEVIEASITAQAVGAEYVVEDEDEPGNWKATTATVEQKRQFTFDQLGVHTPEREALIAVLRAGGRLVRDDTDSGMLALGKALTKFFRLSDPPFTFDPSRRIWKARFEAVSFASGSDR